jgi:hypothetical protein
MHLYLYIYIHIYICIYICICICIYICICICICIHICICICIYICTCARIRFQIQRLLIFLLRRGGNFFPPIQRLLILREWGGNHVLKTWGDRQVNLDNKDKLHFHIIKHNFWIQFSILMFLKTLVKISMIVILWYNKVERKLDLLQ